VPTLLLWVLPIHIVTRTTSNTASWALMEVERGQGLMQPLKTLNSVKQTLMPYAPAGAYGGGAGALCWPMPLHVNSKP